MAARPHQLLEGVSHELLCPDIAPDSDVHKNRRLEAPAGFDGIDALDTMHNIEMPDGPAPLVLALRRAAQSGYDAGSQITYTWIREVL